jgi:ADP-ribose pyrophosphatase
MVHRINAIDTEIMSCMTQLHSILPEYCDDSLLLETVLNADRHSTYKPKPVKILRTVPIPSNHYSARGIPPHIKIQPYAGYTGSDSRNTINIPRFSTKISYVEEIDEHVNSPAYSPTYYEADILQTAPWADPLITSSINFNQMDGKIDRTSFHGTYVLSTSIKNIKTKTGKFPKNPVGKTGIYGRGVLGKWGPNHAADPIVIKRDPRTKSIHIICIKRKDTGEWALPGGMVEPGDTFSSTLVKEFMEEATNSGEKSDELNETTKKRLRIIFSRAAVVYKGYVDDPRNTDNAWMETVAAVVVLTDAEASSITLEAGDDASNAKWTEYTPDLNLYASHINFVRLAIDTIANP